VSRSRLSLLPQRGSIWLYWKSRRSASGFFLEACNVYQQRSLDGHAYGNKHNTLPRGIPRLKIDTHSGQSSHETTSPVEPKKKPAQLERLQQYGSTTARCRCLRAQHPSVCDICTLSKPDYKPVYNMRYDTRRPITDGARRVYVPIH
jgi:hypothetical protein